MGIVWVGGPVGEIDWQEGGFTPNGRYCSYSLDIACTCKQLMVMVEMVYRLRWISVLSS
jgi:hypothetical protein